MVNIELTADEKDSAVPAARKSEPRIHGGTAPFPVSGYRYVRAIHRASLRFREAYGRLGSARVARNTSRHSVCPTRKTRLLGGVLAAAASRLAFRLRPGRCRHKLLLAMGAAKVERFSVAVSVPSACSVYRHAANRVFGRACRLRRGHVFFNLSCDYRLNASE